MKSTAIDVITIGESMVVFGADTCGPLTEVERFTKRLAGAETNVAIGLARLGKRVAWVSRVGADSFGDFIVRSVRAEGVDCDGVRVDGRRCTGFMLKSLTDDASDPTVEYYRRSSAASQLSLEDFDDARFLSARHLHVTGIAPALSDSSAALVEHAMRFMRAHGASISFDPNLRPSLWPSTGVMVERINHFASLADWVFPGINEGRVLTGCESAEDIAAFYLERGAGAVAVKLGAQGAYYSTGCEKSMVPGIAVARVVDTVGAGDGFAVGVLSALLDKLSWTDAVKRGNAIGARVVQWIGDVEGLPRPGDLNPKP